MIKYNQLINQDKIQEQNLEQNQEQIQEQIQEQTINKINTQTSELDIEQLLSETNNELIQGYKLLNKLNQFRLNQKQIWKNN